MVQITISIIVNISGRILVPSWYLPILQLTQRPGHLMCCGYLPKNFINFPLPHHIHRSGVILTPNIEYSGKASSPALVLCRGAVVLLTIPSMMITTLEGISPLRPCCISLIHFSLQSTPSLPPLLWIETMSSSQL